MSEFEESEYRGPLYNQLERSSNLLWEPGQVFEKVIGIDKASFCLHSYLWGLHGYHSELGGTILRHRRFGLIGSINKPGNKPLPDFKLNLFIQAKRSTYSSRRRNKLRPNINGHYWHFEITPHQQSVLEKLEIELRNDALVVYAAPVFHRQQDLYNHTLNQTIVTNSTFPKASMLTGHSKWYFDQPGITGIGNPDFEFLNDEGLLEQARSMREKIGDYNGNNRYSNLHKISNAVLSVIEAESDSFLASRFAYYTEIIDDHISRFNLDDRKVMKSMLQIETFTYLWKLNWLTF